jgi:hypothetical protein
MLTCPQCKKRTQGLVRKCQTCQADLSLLVEYVGHLYLGLERAEALTRAGELGEAVWAYLEVLEVDPDNATARRQVGNVAAAVRVFDQTSEGRRWRKRLEREKRFRRAMAFWGSDGETPGWMTALFWLLLLALTAGVGYVLGHAQGIHDAGAGFNQSFGAPESPGKTGP